MRCTSDDSSTSWKHNSDDGLVFPGAGRNQARVSWLFPSFRARSHLLFSEISIVRRSALPRREYQNVQVHLSKQWPTYCFSGISVAPTAYVGPGLCFVRIIFDHPRPGDALPRCDVLDTSTSAWPPPCSCQLRWGHRINHQQNGYSEKQMVVSCLF